MSSGLRTYGESSRGRDHVTMGKPCQDASVNTLLDEHTALLVAADGVGSAAHAEEGSRIAAETVKELLSAAPRPVTPGVIRSAYVAAFDRIKAHCAANSGHIEDYDTTLTVAVFDTRDGSLTYGHSGDGGILALRSDGIVKEITRPQKGPDGTSVLPLRAVGSWEFDRAPGDYVSVVAVTDGVRDILVPHLLSLSNERVYVRLFTWIADIRQFDRDHLDEGFASRLRNLESDRWSRFTNDDFTLTVAIDTDRTAAARADSYYAEPDWKGLDEKWRRAAYPELYRKAPEPVMTAEEFRYLDTRRSEIRDIETLLRMAEEYRNGRFSPVDLSRSCMMLIIAADEGSTDARRTLSTMPYQRMEMKIRVTIPERHLR